MAALIMAVVETTIPQTLSLCRRPGKLIIPILFRRILHFNLIDRFYLGRTSYSMVMGRKRSEAIDLVMLAT